MINEHWLHANRLHQLGEISNAHNWHARASCHSSEEVFGIKRGQGGVAIIWDKKLNGISVVETLNSDRICAVRMENRNGRVFVFISIYLPAIGSKENIAVTIDELSSFIDSLGNDHTPIIAGDFNGDMGELGGPRGRGRPTKNGKIILKFMKEYNLVSVNMANFATGPVNTFESHNGTSAIDHVMIPKYMLDDVYMCHVGRNRTLNTSDHQPVEVVLRIPLMPHSMHTDSLPDRIQWNKLKNQDLLNRFQGIFLEETIEVEEVLNGRNIPNSQLIDHAFDSIVKALHTATEIVPRCKFKKNLKPYWCEELNLLKKDKMFWFGQWKREGRSLDENNYVRRMMKSSKKMFNKRIRQLSNEYQNQLIAEAATKAEVDRNGFWRLMKTFKGKRQASYSAVKNRDGVTVYELNDILDVWSDHFDKLSNPRNDTNFSQDNFIRVNEFISETIKGKDKSEFLDNPFSEKEIADAIKHLNLGKTPGHDGITSEHVKYAGEILVRILCVIFNLCVDSEYIPCNFRRGIQVPLYKGKNTCPLDPDNYRGITLLSTFNKLFEAVIWGRISKWWVDAHVTSVLQGAARKGFSCVHTALTLQETISRERESGKKVFVAYFDVSKAFDSVWTNGLFFQLHKMGITGNLWRLLYKSYVNFLCCVRIGGKDSNWYSMDCGIHQGGYLSLVKYTAYIDSLIQSLEKSNLCSNIFRVKTSPVGYADDLAASTTSKQKMDFVMHRVHRHGCEWRYSFNASKSAVLVYGESTSERRLGTENRMFSLGGERVKERLYYDHVGIKSCIKGDGHVRTEEKISKARKVLNMNTNVGIRKGGLNLMTCNLIYWTIVIPTLLFGCEVWVIKHKDIELLNAFQRYAARRLQRFRFNSFNATSYACLGWMNIIQFIKARKIIFLRTILVMEEYMPIKRILIARIDNYEDDNVNQFDSPLMQILSFCAEFQLLDRVRVMATNPGGIMSKSAWKKLVWEKAWGMEYQRWDEHVTNDHRFDLLKQISSRPQYSVWWLIADADQSYMRKCEIMIKILCHTSLLKSDDSRLLRGTFSAKACIMCQHAAYEDARHMVMQCSAQSQLRMEMYSEIDRMVPDARQLCSFDVLLGNHIAGWESNEMLPVWLISCCYIVRMYYDLLNYRNRYE